MPGSVCQQFQLINIAHSFSSSQKQILNFINDNLYDRSLKENLQFRTKIIITELLTNAIKHAGNAETFIIISITDREILIEKTDKGNRFSPGQIFNNHRALLSRDDIHSVFAIIDSDNQIRFISEEHLSATAPDINDIMEHFGLLIITKAADEFTYRYDQLAATNSFKVRLTLY